MKSKSLVLASILAISTAAFAQAPVPAEQAAPGSAASRPMPPRGPHMDGKSWTRAEAMAKAGEHFDRADANKDGIISPDERKAAHEKMRAMHDQRKGGMKGDSAMPTPPSK